MKKTLLAIAVSSLVSTGALASDHGSTLDHLTDNAYAKVTLGLADMGLSDSGLALTGTFGKHLDDHYPGLRGEVDLSMSLTDAESSYSGSMGATGKLEASYWAVGAYAVYEHKLDSIAEPLSVYGRLGLVYSSVDVDFTYEGLGTQTGSSGSSSSVDIGFGAGVSWAVNDRLDVIGEYNTVDEVDLLSAGIRYRF